jgi:hypothetical protein
MMQRKFFHVFGNPWELPQWFRNHETDGSERVQPLTAELKGQRGIKLAIDLMSWIGNGLPGMPRKATGQKLVSTAEPSKFLPGTLMRFDAHRNSCA